MMMVLLLVVVVVMVGEVRMLLVVGCLNGKVGKRNSDNCSCGCDLLGGVGRVGGRWWLLSLVLDQQTTPANLHTATNDAMSALGVVQVGVRDKRNAAGMSIGVIAEFDIKKRRQAVQQRAFDCGKQRDAIVFRGRQKHRIIRLGKRRQPQRRQGSCLLDPRCRQAELHVLGIEGEWQVFDDNDSVLDLARIRACSTASVGDLGRIGSATMTLSRAS
ncbi:hypothetical protein CAOG_009887 [Capsaspora owczarzaki ATCC 30864]|uniref:Secreted protein n=1 Tax=Capsaspora owczarzaki (strain ATCC 30864) TaxID=595528 RepID=A0A0D2VUX4_CAPO3|nr:hypothetical protein CAOG_009887 [Capsaspora owczarzaki ATCC 30864]